MPNFTVAKHRDYPSVRDFYYSLTDAMADAEFKPGWENDVYPAQNFLINSIKNGELYILEDGGKIIACAVANHEYNEGYRDIKWSVSAKDSELIVIHALGVSPEHSGKGMAKIMVRHIIGIAKEKNIKTVRLDVLKGNIPAEKAYLKCGFNYVDTIQMYYEDTGLTDYKAFELIF